MVKRGMVILSVITGYIVFVGFSEELSPESQRLNQSQPMKKSLSEPVPASKQIPVSEPIPATEQS
jgi:hypothetical protein